MNGKISFSAIVILIIGLALAWGIINMDNQKYKKVEYSEHQENKSTDQRGKHGGWLLREKNFKIEVEIFEDGIPPQFRVYVTSTEPVRLEEVRLNIILKRLDRVDSIGFKPSGDYLLGDKVVAEPHSFEMTVNAEWKEKNYQWQLSQLEGRAEFSPEAIQNAGLIFKKIGPGN